MMLHPMARRDTDNLKLCGVNPLYCPWSLMTSSRFSQMLPFQKNKIMERHISNAMLSKSNLVDAFASKGLKMLNFKEAETGAIFFALKRA